MPNRPIAVITVCLNAIESLSRTVDSVCQLGDARTKHIIIDGGSTDGTVTYLAGVADRLHYWSSELDAGIYDAMNKGWSIAPLDSYVLFLGAGDRICGLPTQKELDDAERISAPIIFGTSVVNDKPFRSRFTSELRLRNTLHHQSLMILKEAHNGAPFNAAYRVYGDWDFNVRLWQSGARATRSSGLIADVAPLGASKLPPLRETFVIAKRNSGVLVAGLAWLIAARSRLRPALKRLLIMNADPGE